MNISQPVQKFKFMGPAQQEFPTLIDQSTYFLDTFWHHWRDYSQPESYILPPVFYFKHADVSDEAFELAQETKNGKIPHVIKDRFSDEAEHGVYNAICQLIHEKVSSPFIAFHNLNIDRIKKNFDQLFPEIPWNELKENFGDCFREYDFLLIGPKIGILVIEVKNSGFRQKKHFSKECKFLPDEYRYGLQQLKSTEVLVGMLEACGKMNSFAKIRVRKILYTPNVEKSRYTKWVAGFDENWASKIEETIGEVIQWFQEDDFSVYDELKKILINDSNFSMSRSIYENFGPLLAAMASISILKDKPTDIALDRLNFSENDVILRENSRIETQDPVEKSKLTPHSLLAKISKKGKCEIFNPSKIVFLTPDQQKALNGPCRQFIFGAAGTGKTIVLQSKALELLSRGQSVLVLAPKNFIDRYVKLFENFGFKKFKVCGWPMDPILKRFNKFCKKFVDDVPGIWRQDLFNHVRMTFRYIKEKLDNRPNYMKNIFKFLLEFDHIFVDDAFDDQEYVFGEEWIRFINPSLSIMAFSQIVNTSQFVWIALDSYLEYYLPLKFCSGQTTKLLLENAVFKESDFKSDRVNFGATILKRVMRCSENIFRAGYPVEVQWHKGTKPLMGHKIQGPITIKIRDHGKTEKVASEKLWDLIETELKKLSEKGIDFQNVSIIFGTLFNQKILRDHSAKIKATKKNMFTKEKMPLITEWNKVSSLEWPVIIYAVCMPGNVPWFDRTYLEYQKYRAMSRATSKLIDIMVKYNI